MSYNAGLVQASPGNMSASEEGFATAVWRRRLDKASNLGASQEQCRRLSKNSNPEPSLEPIQTVLGVSLSEVIKFANVPITLHKEGRERYVYGHVPRYIAKIGLFLKQKGMLCHPKSHYNFSIGSRTNF